MTKQEENRLTLKYTSIGMLIIIYIQLLGILALLLISFFYPKNNIPMDNKKVISFTMTPSEVINEYSSLSEDMSFNFTSEVIEDSYIIKVKLSTPNDSVMLGSTSPHDYIYSIRDDSNNTLNINIDICNKDDVIIHDYTDLSVDIYVGEDNPSKRKIDNDKYTLANNVVTYSDNSYIYLHTLSISFLVKIDI